MQYAKRTSSFLFRIILVLIPLAPLQGLRAQPFGVPGTRRQPTGVIRDSLLPSFNRVQYAGTGTFKLSCQAVPNAQNRFPKNGRNFASVNITKVKQVLSASYFALIVGQNFGTYGNYYKNGEEDRLTTKLKRTVGTLSSGLDGLITSAKGILNGLEKNDKDPEKAVKSAMGSIGGLLDKVGKANTQFQEEIAFHITNVKAYKKLLSQSTSCLQKTVEKLEDFVKENPKWNQTLTNVQTVKQSIADLHQPTQKELRGLIISALQKIAKVADDYWAVYSGIKTTFASITDGYTLQALSEPWDLKVASDTSETINRAKEGLVSTIDVLVEKKKIKSKKLADFIARGGGIGSTGYPAIFDEYLKNLSKWNTFISQVAAIATQVKTYYQGTSKGKQIELLSKIKGLEIIGIGSRGVTLGSGIYEVQEIGKDSFKLKKGIHHYSIKQGSLRWIDKGKSRRNVKQVQ